jgi:signal transduction histidine kinase/ligand-binding sensor domain-containing protein
MRRLRLFLTIILFAGTGAAYTQPYYFRHYQVENGLSNNSVFCSVQDKNGFMWFGTKDGLNRFDGYRFKTFHINAGNESSLTNDHITALALDQHGVLWVGSKKGLFRFDGPKERLVPLIDTLPEINEVFIDNLDRVWFISGYTVYAFEATSKRLTRFAPEQYFFATSLFAQDGYIWISSLNGYLHRLNPKTRTFTSFNVFAHSPKASSENIEKIVYENGSIFIGTTSQGLKQFNIQTNTYKDLLVYNADKTAIFVRDIIQSGENEFWVATESGIYILNTITGNATQLKKKYLNPYSLSDNAVYTLYKDKEGGIWAGTYFGGVNYFPKQYSTFQKYFPDYSGHSISGSAVREICKDASGNIWIGTEDAGLNKLETKTGKITRFEPTGLSTSIAYYNIHGLMSLGHDLWVGTFEHGLDILDTRTGKVRKHYTAGKGPDELKSNFIVSMLQTGKGEIYIGTGNGLCRFVPQTNSFIHSDLMPGNGFISCLLEDYTGKIWVGTHDRGLYYFDPFTKEKGYFVNAANPKNSLTATTINALYEDSYHNLWIATEGGGLCQLSKDRKRFTRLTTKNGLPSNFVFKVLEDNKKNLWITTSKGLVNMDVDHETTTVYTKANGLINNQFNYNSGCKDADGRLYFGSVSGMITFNPDAFYKNQFVPSVYITGFQVQNKELEVGKDSSILKKSTLYTDQITLPYNQSSFSIDFAALSYTSPEMTEYKYKMEGLDKDWTYLKSNRKVYFTNLNPGTYRFQVKAGTNGNWKEQVRELTIQITPPFWATKWAYIFYIITVICIVYYLTRTYHRIQEDKKEKEIYEAKIEFFTNIAHEIKTPLTLIKGPVENLREMVEAYPEIIDDVSTMERNTDRLVNLINQILDFRKTETKGFSLDFTPVNLNLLIQDVYETFEPLARKRNLSYNLNMPPAPVTILADEEALHKILTNLFSNAIKYAEKEISIKVNTPKQDQEKLVIEISNDGPLIPKELKEKIFEPFFRIRGSGKQKGTGLGLALARSLVELHNGKLYLKKSENDLNAFIMELPGVYNPNKKLNQKESNSQPTQTHK